MYVVITPSDMTLHELTLANKLCALPPTESALLFFGKISET